MPDLDAEVARASEAEALVDPALGLDEAARRRSLTRARTVTRALTLAAGLIFAWCAFAPQPYVAAVLAAVTLPWIAVALVVGFRSLYQLDAGFHDARPTVVHALILPGAALSLRAVFDVTSLDWMPALLPALAGGAAFATMAAVLQRQQRKLVAMLGFMVIGGFYGYGAGMLGNALLDRSPADVFRTPVLEKHVSTGRGTSYTLTLAPWGPWHEPESVSVARGIYETLQPGDVACVRLRAGALRIAWYTVAPCR